MTTAVVVEIAPADESSSYAPFLLDACNVGMYPARCVFGHDAVLGDEGAAIAILKWEGAADSQARLEVGIRIRGMPQWQTRFLSFSPTDPQGERWKTIGFAIATTVGETVRDATASEGNGKVAAAASPAAGEVHASDAGRAARSWIDAQFSIVTGAQVSSPALGGEVRFSSKIHGDRPFLFGAAACTVARGSLDGLSIVRPRALAGGGFSVLRLPGGVDVAVRAHVFLELIDATATESATGVRGSGQRWLEGLGEILDWSWMPSHAVGIVAGVGVTETVGPTDVTAHGQVLAHIPSVELDAAAGLRLALP